MESQAEIVDRLDSILPLTMQSQKRGGLASYEARRRRTTLPHRAPPRAHPARRTRPQEIVKRSRTLEFRTAVEAIPDLHRFLSWIKPCEHGREEDERGGGRRDGVLCPFMCARRPARTTPATAGWSAGH